MRKKKEIMGVPKNKNTKLKKIKELLKLHEMDKKTAGRGKWTRDGRKSMIRNEKQFLPLRGNSATISLRETSMTLREKYAHERLRNSPLKLPLDKLVQYAAPSTKSIEQCTTSPSGEGEKGNLEINTEGSS